MRVILHVGTNRTASSSIQAYLQRHAPQIHPGLHYIPTPDLPLHIPNLIDSTPLQTQTLVISHEGLYLSNPDTLARTARALAAHPRVDNASMRVVVFVRDHLSFLASHYVQAVKDPLSSFSGSFTDFASLAYPDAYFAPRLRVLARAFSRPGQLVIAPYRPHPSAVLAFLKAADLPLATPDQTAAFAQLPLERHNPSISGNLLFYTRILNAYAPHQLTIRELETLATYDPSFTEPPAIPPALHDQLTQTYAQDVRALRDEFNLTLSPAPPASPASLTSPDLTRLPADRRLLLRASREFATATTSPTFGELLVRYTR